MSRQCCLLTIVNGIKFKVGDSTFAYDVEYIGDFRNAYTYKVTEKCTGSNIPEMDSNQLGAVRGAILG